MLGRRYGLVHVGANKYLYVGNCPSCEKKLFSFDINQDNISFLLNLELRRNGRFCKLGQDMVEANRSTKIRLGITEKP